MFERKVFYGTETGSNYYRTSRGLRKLEKKEEKLKEKKRKDMSPPSEPGIGGGYGSW